MSDQYVGEIRMFAKTGDAPNGWAWCQGQLLAIRSNTTLFSILGTRFGGDGKVTFALPDLRARVAVGAGTATSGTSYALGEMGGEPVHLLSQAEIMHGHGVKGWHGRGTGDAANLATPSPSAAFAKSNPDNAFATALGKATTLAPGAVSTFQGGGQAHNNMMPSLTLQYAIALSGLFPSRP